MDIASISVDYDLSLTAENFIAVCVGNTRITSGLFENDQLKKIWYHEISNASGAADTLCHYPRLVHVGICSVVPAAARIITEALSSNGMSYFEMGVQKSHPLINVYPSLGADRLANAIAAWKYYGQAHPVIVVDYGTATTLEAVLPDGTFAGGFICLGLGKILSALHMETASLPEVGLADNNDFKLKLALDTEHAIASGAILAHVGLTETWINQAKQELGDDAVTIATGGWSKTLSNYLELFDYIDPGLTLKGVKALAPVYIKSRRQVDQS
jgi:type III pantothenate kinase